MEHNKKIEYLHIQINPELKSQFKKTCDNNCQNMTRIIIRAIVDYCKQYTQKDK